MKITEPKTPFPPQYDPATDDLPNDIPAFQLGEPSSMVDWNEVFDQKPRVTSRRSSIGSSSGKHVAVNPADASPSHDAESLAGSPGHEEFEERRRKHYEMHDIKSLLA